MPNRLDTALTNLFIALDLAQTPPIDVEALAGRLGVSSIEERDMVEDGRLDHCGDRTVVTLRPDLTSGRRRFTLAHELAHLLLEHPDTEFTAYRSITSQDDAERACDDIAAALLIPDSWLRASYSHRIPNLSTLRHVSHQTQTSLSASLVRLDEVVGWRRSLLRWRNHSSGWRLAGTAGVPANKHGQIQSSPTTGATLTRTAQRAARDQNVELPLLVDRKPTTLPVQLSARGSSAIALLDNSIL